MPMMPSSLVLLTAVAVAVAAALYFTIPVVLVAAVARLGRRIPREAKRPIVYALRVAGFTPSQLTLSELDLGLPLPAGVASLPLPRTVALGIRIVEGRLRLRIGDGTRPGPDLATVILEDDIVVRGSASEIRIVQRNVDVRIAPPTAAHLIRLARSGGLVGSDTHIHADLHVHVLVMGIELWRNLHLSTAIPLGLDPATLPRPTPRDESLHLLPNPSVQRHAPSISPVPPARIFTSLTVQFSHPPRLFFRIQRLDVDLHLQDGNVDRNIATLSITNFDLSQLTPVAIEIRPRVGGIIKSHAVVRRAMASGNSTVEGLYASLRGAVSSFAASIQRRRRKLRLRVLGKEECDDDDDEDSDNDDGDEEDGFVDALAFEDNDEMVGGRLTTVYFRNVRVHALPPHSDSFAATPPNPIRVQFIEAIANSVDISIDLDVKEMLDARKASPTNKSATPPPAVEKRPLAILSKGTAERVVNVIGDAVRKVDRSGVIRAAVKETIASRSDASGEPQAPAVAKSTRQAIVGSVVSGISRIVQKVDREGVIRKAVEKRLADAESR